MIESILNGLDKYVSILIGILIGFIFGISISKLGLLEFYVILPTFVQNIILLSIPLIIFLIFSFFKDNKIEQIIQQEVK